MDHKEERRLFGPIKKGQVWRKRDTGRRGQVFGKKPNNAWCLRFEGSRLNQSHTIKERDLYRFYWPEHVKPPHENNKREAA